MTLSEWSARTKRALFDDLYNGREPSIGAFDSHLLQEAKIKGLPQMGATEFGPESARFEFVYAGGTGTVVVSVHVDAPERIVFMPVPDWVVETVWQGEVSGSCHFEAEAAQLVQRFQRLLEPEVNRAQFQPRQATGRV